MIYWPCLHAWVALASRIHLSRLHSITPLQRRFQPHLCLSFFSSPQPIQLTAESHRKEPNRLLAVLRDNMKQHNDVFNKLPGSQQRALLASKEKGASSWLSALPMVEHGFALHKGAFRDALCLCYGWRPPRLPSNCVCGKQLTIEHALSCACGGFPSSRHNELRDLTAQFLTETCHSVGIEPH